MAYKVKMSGSEKKKNRSKFNIFPKFHVVVVQKNGKEMYKKVCCTCKVVFFFLLIRPTELVWLFVAVTRASHLALAVRTVM